MSDKNWVSVIKYLKGITYIHINLMTELDIVSLIEQNPITKLSGDYNNKLITKIKDKFNDSQQQMFLASFYCYLNYDNKNDFVIDLDNVWVWLGFSSKHKAKELLNKSFILDKDYKLLLTHEGKQTEHTKGGHNKQTILLNIDTFKRFCLKAGTKKADEIHEYFIKLEETLHEIIQEESIELKIQLQNYKNEHINLNKQIITNEREKLIIRENTILQQFPDNTQCVYYGIIDNLSDNNEKLIKFGNSNFLKNRVTKHKETYSNFWLLNAFKVDNKLQIENAIKDNLFFKERIRTIILNKKKYVELLCIENITFIELDKTIKEIINNIEYSPENYIKMLKEIKILKQQLEIKNDNNQVNENILLHAENKRLKKENIMLMKKLTSFKQNKNSKVDILSNISEDSNINIQQHEIDNYINTISSLKENYSNEVKKNKQGKYYTNEIIYDKLVGSREEVWNCKAYKTTGGLIKNDFMLNRYGKIVSKKKSTIETLLDRFKMHGINPS